jgi:hypothetical protein
MCFSYESPYLLSEHYKIIFLVITMRVKYFFIITMKLCTFYSTSIDVLLSILLEAYYIS